MLLIILVVIAVLVLVLIAVILCVIIFIALKISRYLPADSYTVILTELAVMFCCCLLDLHQINLLIFRSKQHVDIQSNVSNNTTFVICAVFSI